MKIQIIVEHNPLTSGKSTKQILEDVVLTVREMSYRYPTVFRAKDVEVTITEKR